MYLEKRMTKSQHMHTATVRMKTKMKTRRKLITITTMKLLKVQLEMSSRILLEKLSVSVM
ncbi:ORF1042 [White spot syndrome virus]|uniref:ORF1042 n=1 Tax=White spot syndrome virus TaxID=342409 RepID=A0A2D3I7A2_9VIRU|nr:ORF1042 [White spot syndrome virus]